MPEILTEFPWTVVYGRYGHTHRRSFPTLEELAGWVERKEDQDEIWAAAVEHDGVLKFEHTHPPAAIRWIQIDKDLPWPGEHP